MIYASQLPPTPNVPGFPSSSCLIVLVKVERVEVKLLPSVETVKRPCRHHKGCLLLSNHY